MVLPYPWMHANPWLVTARFWSPGSLELGAYSKETAELLNGETGRPNQ